MQARAAFMAGAHGSRGWRLFFPVISFRCLNYTQENMHEAFMYVGVYERALDFDQL
jgi:hypothetical protein